MKFKNFRRPEEYVWFSLNFELEGGSISLDRQTRGGDVEGIEFSFKSLVSQLQMRETNKVITVKMREMRLDLVNEVLSEPESGVFQKNVAIKSERPDSKPSLHKTIMNVLRLNEYQPVEQFIFF